MADDDVDDRNLSRMAIDALQQGIQLEFAENGEELIQVLTSKVNTGENLPDLIVLDLNMPKKNGMDALQEIKAHPKLKELNVIIFTTSCSERDRIESVKRGASDFIVKPPNFNKLMETFREICDREIPNA
ncbi:response regulator [soil metagenome]